MWSSMKVMLWNKMTATSGEFTEMRLDNLIAEGTQ